jgi:hypothetical protein
MIRLAIGIFIVLLLLPFQAHAQEPASTNIEQQLQALQPKLDEFQQTFSSFDFTVLRLDNAWLDRLNMDRSSCLDTMKAASQIASNFATAPPPKLRQEVVLESSLTETVACLFKVHDLLNLASLENRPTQEEIRSSSGAAVSLRWQNQIGSFVSQIFELRNRLFVDTASRLKQLEK